jgi:hypothetical protein
MNGWIDRQTDGWIERELEHGGKLVVFKQKILLRIITFRFALFVSAEGTDCCNTPEIGGPPTEFECTVGLVFMEDQLVCA